ncbi:MAG TPA: TVP38/TMEM64 family protein [Candidatus Cybelea sp.]|nr:TVP38/TMEM64 family protein [Candidatus Cybelea sp.]
MNVSTSSAQRRHALLRFAPLALLALGLALFFAFGLNRYFSFTALKQNREWLDDSVRQHPLLAPLVYTLLYAAAAALSLPIGSLLSIVGGFVFGAVGGTLLTVVGATLGGTLLFLAARTAFGDVLRERAGGNIQKMQQGFAEDAFNYLMFLRLVPLFPFWLVNLAPALLNVRLTTFVLATFIGIIPGTFVYTYVGRGLGSILDSSDSFSIHSLITPQVLIALGLLGCLSLVPVAYRKLRGRRG